MNMNTPMPSSNVSGNATTPALSAVRLLDEKGARYRPPV
jgi:hypothetical protein